MVTKYTLKMITYMINARKMLGHFLGIVIIRCLWIWYTITITFMYFIHRFEPPVLGVFVIFYLIDFFTLLSLYFKSDSMF